MDTTNKPKTIATIDVTLTMPKVDKRTWMQESIEDHLNCVLCGTAMAFTHKADYVTGVISEDAHCPGCRVRNRQSVHTLQ